MKEERILKFLKEKAEPVSINEIAINTGMTRGSVELMLAKLEEAGKVARAGNSRYSMWCLNENFVSSVAEDYNRVKAAFNDGVANSKGAVEELEARVINAEAKIDKMHIDMIATMGVFVAIFALIINTAQRANELSQADLKMCVLIKGLFFSTFITVIAIACLLALIKWFFGFKKK